MFGILIGNAEKNDRKYKGKNIIDLPEKYIVIDTETTGLDPNYDSIIEVSALKVENNCVIDKYTSLISQKVDLDNCYPEIVELTGITQSMLDSAPSEETVINEFYYFVGNDIIIGHNVNFDINFIYDCMATYNLNFTNDFIDTMRFARRLLPDLKHHRLSDIADYFNISTEGSHRALKDCEITFDCYVALKSIAEDRYPDVKAFKATWNKKSVSAKDIKLTAQESEIDETHPFYNKVCVFTGALQIPRKDAMQIVVNLGGQVADSVTKKTNYLILGNNDYCTSIKDGKSSKHKKAEKLKLEGQDIEIISEDVFIDIINS